MAKAKRAKAKAVAQQLEQEPETGTEETELDDDGEASEEEDVIGELRGLGVGDGYRYSVQRIPQRPGERGGYCMTYTAGDLSLDAIRDQFGGGKYRIRVLDSGGHYVAMRTVEIVDLPKPPAAPAPTTPAGPDLSGFAQVLQALKPAPGGDGAGATERLIVAMMDSQNKMFQAIMSRPVPEGPKLTDILALINAGRERTPAGSDPVSLLLKGLELGRTLGDGESSMIDVARDGLTTLRELAAKQSSAPATAPAAMPRLAAPAGSAAAPVAAASPATEGQDVGVLQQLQWLRAQLQALINQASRGKSAELYAEVMLDNLPPFITADELRKRLSAPDAVEQLASVDARVRQFAPWFEEFRQAALGFLDDAQQPGGPDTGDGGDDNTGDVQP